MATQPVGADTTTGALPSVVEARIDNKIATGVSGKLTVLIYSGSAYPARPSVPAGLVRYVGPIQPTTWLTNDEWVNNS